jgi:hypothetical protein
MKYLEFDSAASIYFRATLTLLGCCRRSPAKILLQIMGDSIRFGAEFGRECDWVSISLTTEAAEHECAAQEYDSSATGEGSEGRTVELGHARTGSVWSVGRSGRLV